MALQQSKTTSSPPIASKVARSFVNQYYNILERYPKLVHNFYKDCSMLSRPGPNGEMTSVTTMQDIKDKILSMDYIGYKHEILTTHSQSSCNNGVMLLVTGFVRGENMKKKFIQSIYLAPQEDDGFFVMNDIFSYTNDSEFEIEIEKETSLTNDTEHHIPKVSLLPSADNKNDKKVNVSQPSNIISEVKTMNSWKNVLCPSPVKEPTPKKSYVSVVNANTPSQTKTTPNEPPLQSQDVQSKSLALYESTSLKKNSDDPAKNHSVYVGRLPLNSTHEQVKEAFERFGPIRTNGIHIKDNKQSEHGYCYGFVEFESLHSKENALKAVDVIVAGSRVNIREAIKSPVERENLPVRQGGFRNDKFKDYENLPVRQGGFRNDKFKDYENFRGFPNKNVVEKEN